MADELTPRERIEKATLWFSKAREELRTKMNTVQAELRDVAEQHRLEMIALLDQATNAREELASLLEANASLFDSPRTVNHHGIKVGFQKQQGKVEFKDEPEVIKRIKQALPELVDTLIEPSESVRKDAMKKLTVQQLAAVGASLVGAGDAIVIKATDDAIDKMLKGLASDSVFGEDLTKKMDP